MRPGHETTRAWASLLALAVAVGTSACNGPAHISPPPSLPSSSTTTPSPTTTTTSAPTSTLAIEARVVPVLTDNFNPFDTTAPLGEMGVPSYIYEPLLQYSELQINQYYPWLASSWSFSSSGLTITFNLRPKVTWDDGSAFTAADVAYTFNLLKANPGIDEGIPVVSAQATNPSTFVLTLSQPGYSLLYNIAHVPIVKAGYAAGAAPRGFVDRVPDGTGPYELAHPEDFSSRQVVLTARPGYWQGPPPIRTLVFPAFSDRAAVVTALREGKLDWAGEEMGGDVSSYTDKDKVHNHFWAPPVGCVALELNLVKPAFADLAVRKAISDAIDRAALSRQLGGGAGSAVSTLSCLVLPADDQFLSPSDTADVPAQPEPGSIAALMAAAGYHMSTQGYWTSAARRRLYVNIEDPAGSSLAEAAADVAQQLNAAGFDASSSAPPAAKWRRDIVAG
ncbi:MAG TPA: ABC transporter substrate-binding protein, partial [Acidimicrobiales bacterium]|nr:ABC transporter substrate-binding protein [Acidimicrobiales bacterium]